MTWWDIGCDIEEEPSEINRTLLHKAQPKLKKYLIFEENFWKQILGLKWERRVIETFRFFTTLRGGKYCN